MRMFSIRYYHDSFLAVGAFCKTPLRALIIFFATCSFFLFHSCGPKAVDWTSLGPETGSPVYELYFTTPDTGFAVGGLDYDSEKILRTTDGGLTWDSLPALYGQAIQGLDFGSSQLGFTGGIAGRILRTKDAGASWQLFQMDFYNNLLGVAVASDSIVMVVGGGGRGEGEIWRSTDAGNSWAATTFDFELQAITFPEPDLGFVCGYGAVLRTENAGVDWEVLDASGDLYGALSFPSSDTGYVIGLTGEILRTTDRGDTWKTLRSASAFVQHRKQFHDVVFRNGKQGYIVGKKSIILRTEDAGKSWEKLESPVEDDFYTACLAPDGALWIAGESGQIFRMNE